ncbi:MAG TPA: zf-HC2 domain-containing protein [Planctomycetota bacterium]|nr:zf-HC2 domain-containing protein [Planctomycetota bacterium]HRR82051.1 zf-HC2 domain-containing protein [Planctomycetota bacterium]HRT94526.1 zf-HC2 domain-containing protein [Planctomycetota bacterium]
MTCKEVVDQLDALELGALTEEAREAVEAHLASCSACRTALAEVRRVDEALRSAFAWAEPSPAFAQSILARARTQVSWRRWLAAGAAAAAAAACLTVALLRPHRTQISPSVEPVSARREAASIPGGLLAGELLDGYGLPARRLVQGRPYVAAEPAAVGLAPDSLLLVASGSQFTGMPGPTGEGTGLSLLAGSLIGQVGGRGRELAIELAPELGGAIARTRGCEFYSAGFPANRLAAGMAFPEGALAHWPESIRIHVFSGHLDLDLGAQKLTLAEGDSAIIAGGVSAGTARVVEERARALRAALGEALVEKRARYARLRDEYARRLLELRSPAVQEGLPHLSQRVEFVERLLHAHAATLSRLEANHPEFFELDAAAAELRRLEQVREEADHSLERFLVLMAALN